MRGWEWYRVLAEPRLEPLEPRPGAWEHFQLQVFAAVIAGESGSSELWLKTTLEWLAENDRRVWPNFYCGVNS